MNLSDRFIRGGCLLILAGCLLAGAGVCPPFMAKWATADGCIDNARMIMILWAMTGVLLAITAVMAVVIVTDQTSGVRRVLHRLWAWRWQLGGVIVAVVILATIGVPALLITRNRVDILARLNSDHSLYASVQAVRSRNGEQAALDAVADYFLQRPVLPSITPALWWMVPTERSESRAREILQHELSAVAGLPVLRWRPGESIVWTAPTPWPVLFQLQRHTALFDLLLTEDRQLDRRRVDVAMAFAEEWRRGNQGWPNNNPFAWNDHIMADRIQAHMLLNDAQQRLGLSSRRSELTFLETLLQHANRLMDESAHNFVTNHGMMQNCALLSIALAYPEFDSDAQWQRTAIGRMHRHLEESVSRQGVFLELTPGYHFVGTVLSLWFVARCQLAGIDLDPVFESTVRKMLVFCQEILNPDRSLPLIADTYADVVDVSRWPWEHLPNWPELVALRKAVSQSQEPPNEPTGRLWPESGYFLLRVPAPDWTVESEMMFTLKAGPRSLAHSHPDALSMTLFGHGRRLLTGPGYPSYGDPARRMRLIGTTSQNTVSVDNASQRIGGATVRFCDIRPSDLAEGRPPDFVAIQGESRLYEGVLHRRTAFFGPACAAILLVDELSSGDKHIYRQHFRIAEGLEGETTRLGQLSVVERCGAADPMRLRVDAWTIEQRELTRPGCSVDERVAGFAAFGGDVTYITRLDISGDGEANTIRVDRDSVIWEGENGRLKTKLPINTPRAYEWIPEGNAHARERKSCK